MDTKAKGSKILSESDHVASERNTKKALESQPTVKMVIFPDGGGPTLKCTINGVDFTYPKGVEVEVPVDVARVINNSIKAKRAIDDLSRKNAYRNGGVIG